jgi:mannose-1-phosphate guanylyltransferase/mannose-6-phosphate isomerase
MFPFRAAILCGGGGTRLWPLSSEALPKQFHALTGSKSLLSETVERAAALPGAKAPFLVTGLAHAAAAAAHAARGGVPGAELLLEPVARNTAPAAAFAALAASADDPRTVLALLPSDHHVTDAAAFGRALAEARTLAESGHIVTIGIVPTRPETGFGYIRRGEPLGAGFKVDRFVEKPDAGRAEEFFASGAYLWNAGMFVFRADILLEELTAYRPDIAAAVREAWNHATRTEHGLLAGEADWAACPSESIDVAVAEKTARAAVVPAEMGWSDVGSWASLREIAGRDAAGNTLRGDAISIGADGCYVLSTGRKIAVIGVKDVIVVESGDAILVVHKDATQSVKQAAEAFRSRSK